jgi:hypothetical protein
MRLQLTSLFAAAALAVSACSDSSTSPGTGKLTVKMTDAPFPFGDVSRVDVFVVRIDAKTASTTDAAAADASEMSGWTTIATPNAAFNLLDLQGGVTANLGTSSLATGTYQGFRLILDVAQSSVTLKDGSHPSVVWPSAARTGIKINLDAPIAVAADSSVMILDFDVGRSFVMRGNSISQNGLLFKPVIRATATELTASASGTVRADTPTGALMAGATVEVLVAGSLIDDADPDHIVASTVTDANGAFRISFLLPGTYVVRVTPLASSTYLPALLGGGLTIVAGTDVTGKLIVVTK